MQADTLFKKLMKEIPEFKPVYKEHIDYYEGLLPHVLMGDFTRFVVDNYRRGIAAEADSERHMDVVRRSLDFMERVMASPDLKLQELVSVSFLENLHQASEDYEGIKALLGPRLRRELAVHEASA